MRSQVGLESEGIDGGEESFDGVERGSGNGCVLRHVTSTPRQNRVDGGDTIGRRLREGWRKRRFLEGNDGNCPFFDKRFSRRIRIKLILLTSN